MRRAVEGLCSPIPLIETMPSVYRGDFFTEQLCASFDEVLAPVFATLDCLTAYFDPRTAPADMLGWLAGWIGLTVDETTDADRKRESIITGIALLPWSGTPRSVREAVIAAFGCATEVVESGAATWSTTPDSRPGGSAAAGLVVRVFIEAGDVAEAAAAIDHRSLDALVDAVKPAHVPHRIEIVTRDAQARPDGRGPAGPPGGDGDGHTRRLPSLGPSQREDI